METLAKKTNSVFKKSFFSNYCLSRGVFEGNEFFLVKPLTYMNRSGLIFDTVGKKLKITPDNIVVICDNMDLFPGVVRLKKNGGDAGHNGLKSIIEHLNTTNFCRLYVGVGRPLEKDRVAEYVLGIAQQKEKEEFIKGINLAVKCLLDIIIFPVEKVMNEINKTKNIPAY
jgi:PTH1 family peptidyl-tRNA hydrolase